MSAPEMTTEEKRYAMGDAWVYLTQVWPEVEAERNRQIELHGDGDLKQTTLGMMTFMQDVMARMRPIPSGQQDFSEVLLEEVAEVVLAPSLAHCREELIQVAAVALRWAQSLDRQAGRFRDWRNLR